jgi:hypothetical protein
VKLAILIALSHFTYIVVRAWRWRTTGRSLENSAGGGLSCCVKTIPRLTT